MKHTMTRWAARGTLAALALVHLTCHQAILTAPEGSELHLTANPGRIAAHGAVSVISALVIDGTGNPVPDGTVVQFFTTLGRIQEQGKTNDGVARVNLTSDSHSGDADITAFSGLVSDNTSVTIGGLDVELVVVRAEPSIITTGRSSRIVATVIDVDGNPVANVPVVFTVPGNAEFMENSGRPVFTNNNGEAEDVLRTRRAAGFVGSVVVTATVLNADATSGTTTVQLDLR